VRIKKIPYGHTCYNTGKVEKNIMATNHWVRGRVLSWITKDPSVRVAALKKRLEEEYHIKLSYYVVCDGKEMARDLN
jgi:hypothetical protein